MRPFLIRSFVAIALPPASRRQDSLTTGVTIGAGSCSSSLR